jgi:hypothetical protein
MHAHEVKIVRLCQEMTGHNPPEKDRLPRQSLEKAFELRECCVHVRLAQTLPGPLTPLFGKVLLGCNRLRNVKRLEVSKSGVSLKAIWRFRRRIHR